MSLYIGYLGSRYCYCYYYFWMIATTLFNNQWRPLSHVRIDPWEFLKLFIKCNKQKVCFFPLRSLLFTFCLLEFAVIVFFSLSLSRFLFLFVFVRVFTYVCAFVYLLHFCILCAAVTAAADIELCCGRLIHTHTHESRIFIAQFCKCNYFI